MPEAETGLKRVSHRHSPVTSTQSPATVRQNRCGALAFHTLGQGRGGVPASISGPFKCRWTPHLKSGRAVLSP